MPFQARPPDGTTLHTFHRWYWLLVPSLAILAYLAALQIGFLSDDYTILGSVQDSGINLQVFIPAQHFYLYRPLGVILIWQLGLLAWGLNPLLFHLQGLLLHAASALVLALWLATVSGSRGLGWLAGALFGVFPLHIEALGWTAAQWDVLAFLFAVLSLLFFSTWWIRSEDRAARPGLYFASLLLFGLAIFTKESTLTFLPVLPISAWASTRRFDRRTWLRLALVSLPFCAILGLNAVIRLTSWGHLGGYGRYAFDYRDLLPVLGERLKDDLSALLSPINRSLLGNEVSTVMGSSTALLLIVALFAVGRSRLRLLVLSTLWILFALIPVLSIPVATQDLENNRLLYLAAGGYTIALATLISSAVDTLRTRRWLVYFSVSLLLATSIATCWLQLSPWHRATTDTSTLKEDLDELLPEDLTRHDPTWYVQNVPDNYLGAYEFRQGLGEAYYFSTGIRPTIMNSPNPSESLSAATNPNSFALGFKNDLAPGRASIEYGAGIAEQANPGEVRGGNGAAIWNFTTCAPDKVSRWRTIHASVRCERGKGLVIEPQTSDPQLIGSLGDLMSYISSTGYLRFRAAIRYESVASPKNAHAQWFWATKALGWTEDNSQSMPVRPDGKVHLYTLFFPSPDASISLLRFDPVDDKISTEISWISIDNPQ